MLLDPIRSTDPPAIPDAPPARAAKLRPQTNAPSTPAARPRTPVLVSPPETPDEVKVQWDNDNGVVVQFTDKKSGEVVRQIPSEQVLSVVRFIRQLIQEQETAKPRTQ
jgi:hypothetical protein